MDEATIEKLGTVLWYIAIAVGVAIDIATWYVAFTNGPIVLAIILVNRIILAKVEVDAGYTLF